jgi:dihydrofolate synthase/folylpolyglutamate synthase
MSDWRKVILEKSNSFMILGSVLGKDWDVIWKYIPLESKVFITEPKVQRALPASQLYYSSRKHRTESILCNSLQDAVMRVKKELSENDALFIGGTTFLVADFLRLMDQRKLF